MRARNLLASWINVATTVAVAFVTAPILVDTLGKAGYGVWCVINAFSAQLALVELGLIASANRELNGQVAAKDLSGASATLSTASVLLGGVTICFTLLIFAGSFFTPVSGEIRLALVLVLIAMSMKIANTPFISNLQCHERLDLVGGIQTASALVRVGLIIALVNSLSVLVVSFIHLFATIVTVVLIQISCRRVAPEVRFSIFSVTVHAMNRLKSIAIWTALKRFAQQVYTSMDTLIIGSIVSTTAVTTYSLGFVLPEHSANFTTQIGRVFSPKILKDAQTADKARVAREVRKAMILIAAVGTPIFLGILVFGNDFFKVWMGPGFEISYHIAAIFACLAFFRAIHRPIDTLLLGVGEVKKPAILFSLAAILNLVLSVALCLTPLGVYGVALASVITVAATELVCIAIAFRHIDKKDAQYTETLTITLVMIIVFLSVGIPIQQIPGQNTWLVLIAKCSASLAVYCLVIWPIVANRLKFRLIPMIRRGVA